MKKSTIAILVIRTLQSKLKTQNDVENYWSREVEKDFFLELSSDDMSNIEEITGKTSKSLELEGKSENSEVWETEVIKLNDYDSNNFDNIEEAETMINYIKEIA